MSEKLFSIENPSAEREQNYKAKILSIINDVEARVRLIIPNQGMDREIHEKRLIDTRKEAAEHSEIRKDLLETFGVPNDSEHVFIFDDYTDQSKAKVQRAQRAFIVFIDALTKEAFYGEGRIGHALLLNNLERMFQEVTGEEITGDLLEEGMKTDPPRFLTFKGFLSTDKFKTLSESSLSMIKTPIFDAEGQVIETPDTWFLTGHSLEGISPNIRPE